MQLIYEPKVKVATVSVFRDYDLKDYASGMHAQNTHSLDHIPEFAGRVCYQSFKNPRPGGNRGYIGHILEVGHGCFDGTTEVLTANGWKFWPDVTAGDSLATINPETHEVTYHKPVRVINYHHKGRMYRVDSSDVDLLVTPDHKMLACVTTTKQGRKRDAYKLIRADELGESSHAYLKSGIFVEGWWTGGPTRNELALLGFTIGDGYLGSKGQVRFHLRKERKIKWIFSLIEKLKPLGYSIYQRGDHYIVSLPDNGFIRELFSQVYDVNREKKIPQSLLTGVGCETLEGLYEGLVNSDGHVGRTSIVFDTTSETLAGQFQQLCMHIGLASNIQYVHTKDQRPTSFGDKTLIRLGVTRRNLRPEINKYSGQSGRSSWIDEWEGQVYCAEVPNNTLYVRRGGKPVWSGNSVLEHSYVGLLITGVSRSLTHELIRHRAGTAFSQLSQRYVEPDNLGYIVPPLIIRDLVAEQCFKSEVTAASASYDRMLNVCTTAISRRWQDDHPDETADREALTYIRKKAREAARSVLPNSIETHIFMSGNLRAWRNILEQRGSIHADLEIRRLAVAIAREIYVYATSVFQDMHIFIDVDGYESLRFDHRKV
jgi:thymidylate synthase (FAD)